MLLLNVVVDAVNAFVVFHVIDAVVFVVVTVVNAVVVALVNAVVVFVDDDANAVVFVALVVVVVVGNAIGVNAWIIHRAAAVINIVAVVDDLIYICQVVCLSVCMNPVNGQAVGPILTKFGMGA
jgi:hypothetical protein